MARPFQFSVSTLLPVTAATRARRDVLVRSLETRALKQCNAANKMRAAEMGPARVRGLDLYRSADHLLTDEGLALVEIMQYADALPV